MSHGIGILTTEGFVNSYDVISAQAWPPVTFTSQKGSIPLPEGFVVGRDAWYLTRAEITYRFYIENGRFHWESGTGTSGDTGPQSTHTVLFVRLG